MQRQSVLSERQNLTTDLLCLWNAQMPVKIAFQSCIPRECRYVPTHTAPFQWNGKDIDPFDARLVTTPFYFWDFPPQSNLFGIVRYPIFYLHFPCAHGNIGRERPAFILIEQLVIRGQVGTFPPLSERLRWHQEQWQYWVVRWGNTTSPSSSRVSSSRVEED